MPFTIACLRIWHLMITLTLTWSPQALLETFLEIIMLINPMMKRRRLRLRRRRLRRRRLRLRLRLRRVRGAHPTKKRMTRILIVKSAMIILLRSPYSRKLKSNMKLSNSQGNMPVHQLPPSTLLANPTTIHISDNSAVMIDMPHLYRNLIGK